MNELAAYLVDYVIGPVPVRHWICTLPPPLRFLLARDAALCGEVSAIFARAVTRYLKSKAKSELGLPRTTRVHAGIVTAIHRASSHLALNVHFHSLVADGVWLTTGSNAAPEFRALSAPSRGELQAISWRVCERTLALLRHRGLWLDVDPKEMSSDEPGLTHCDATSIAGVVTVGANAGARILRIAAIGSLGEASAHDDDTTPPASQAQGYGFNVHAARRISADDRAGLESLARYLLHPPVAQQRLELQSNGKVVWHLKRAFADGTHSFVFDGVDFLAKLAALVFPPRMHRVRYYGVWARRSKLRRLVAPTPPPQDPIAPCHHNKEAQEKGTTAKRPRYDWAKLLARVFKVDVLCCPKCNSRMQRIAWITQPREIQKILNSVGLPGDSPQAAPSRFRPQQELFEVG